MSYYDEIADGYDELHGAEQREKFAAIRALHLISSDDTILDVGHGTGLICAFFEHVTGFDSAEKLLAKSPAETRVGSMNDTLPFEDDSFDWVLCVTALHHAKNAASAIEEFERVAREGLIITLLAALESTEALAQMLVKRGYREFNCGRDRGFVSK